ncbi:MAG: winged helix-turn-helix domain-containing protein [Candidatus Methanoperedens sp.]|nr:winged helix-turn-helix domain-containing protein [Candidatus Methanoperedens sp.]
MSSPFEGLLGNNCELRMFEFLLPLEGVEFNITELAQEVGVSRVTATRIVKKYVDWGVLKSPRTSGNTTYYSINHESPIVKSIEQFNNVLIENILGNETLYEIHDYCEAQKSQGPYALTQAAAGDVLQQRFNDSGRVLQKRIAQRA